MLSHSFAKLIFDKFIANNIRTTSAKRRSDLFVEKVYLRKCRITAVSQPRFSYKYVF